MGKSGAIKGVGADVGELLLQVLGILLGEELGALGAYEEGWGAKTGEAVSDGLHAEGVVAEVGPGGHTEKAETGSGGIGVGWRSQGPDVVGFLSLSLSYADVQVADQEVSQEGTVE